VEISDTYKTLILPGIVHHTSYIVNRNTLSTAHSSIFSILILYIRDISVIRGPNIRVHSW